MKKVKKILHKQLKILAEESKKVCMPDDLYKITLAMVAVADKLKKKSTTY